MTGMGMHGVWLGTPAGYVNTHLTYTHTQLRHTHLQLCSLNRAVDEAASPRVNSRASQRHALSGSAGTNWNTYFLDASSSLWLHSGRRSLMTLFT